MIDLCSFRVNNPLYDEIATLALPFPVILLNG